MVRLDEVFDRPEDDISNGSTNSINSSVTCHPEYKVNAIPKAWKSEQG